MKNRVMLEGPYDQCLSCASLGIECDGPNFLAMSAERWCAWSKKRKNALELTNEELAEKAEVSVATVEKIMAGTISDIRMSTMQNITKVLVNGTWGEHPCADPDQADYKKEAEHLKTELAKVSTSHKELRLTLDNVIANYESDVKNIREDADKKIAYLKSIVDYRGKLFKNCLIALISFAAVIVIAIVLDVLLGDIGWIRF